MRARGSVLHENFQSSEKLLVQPATSSGQSISSYTLVYMQAPFFPHKRSAGKPALNSRRHGKKKHEDKTAPGNETGGTTEGCRG